VTDGQTDSQTESIMANTALCIVLCGRAEKMTEVQVVLTYMSALQIIHKYKNKK